MSTLQIIITIITSIFASGGFQAFLTSRMTRRDAVISEIKKDKDLEKQALLGLLHQELLRECKEYIYKGEISISEYEDLKKYIYDPYASLKGNGTGEALMNRVTEIIKTNKGDKNNG